jgi:GNAT superfamily N-acetyltransferase
MRPANSADGPGIVALAEVAGGSGWWGVEQRRGDASGDQARWVESDGGAIVGYGAIGRRKASVFGLDTLVHPSARARGLGRAFLDRLFEDLGGFAATAVEARVDADHPDALRFLVRRGFFELNRLERVRLELAKADGGIDPAPEGVTVGTLAGVRSAESDRALHEMLAASFHERPVSYVEPFAERPLEELSADLDRALPAGCFVAHEGNVLVGFCGLVPGTAPDRVTAFLTAVAPDRQRRGLARGLKPRTIAWAREAGYRWIYADSPNRAMQELNERLGFVRDAPTEIRMGRRL